MLNTSTRFWKIYMFRFYQIFKLKKKYKGKLLKINSPIPIIQYDIPTESIVQAEVNDHMIVLDILPIQRTDLKLLLKLLLFRNGTQQSIIEFRFSTAKSLEKFIEKFEISE